jgi:hypothetical protein
MSGCRFCWSWLRLLRRLRRRSPLGDCVAVAVLVVVVLLSFRLCRACTWATPCRARRRRIECGERIDDVDKYKSDDKGHMYEDYQNYPR